MLQVPGLIYNWLRFQAWDTLQDSTENSSIDKGENQFGMSGVFLSAPRYDRCPHLSHPSFCMRVNHGPSQQSPREEYKPWKRGTTRRYYAFYTKNMLPIRKSVPISSRQSDHTKTANCSSMVMSPIHQVLPKPSCRAQWKGEEDNADRGRGEDT